MEIPEIGERVIVQIKKVMPYGLIVELLEYPNIEGFVHISHVSSGWVKNIRNFVKENQIKVGEILTVDREKNQLEISFRRITQNDEREKLEQYRQFKRTNMLISIIAKMKNKTQNEAWAAIADPLVAEYGTLNEAFKQILLKGEKAAVNVPKEWIPSLIEVIQKNIQLPEKTIKAILSLQSTDPSGLILVKDVLLAGDSAIKGSKSKIYYRGSGKYAVEITAPDFKEAEGILKKLQDAILPMMQKKKIVGELVRNAA